MQTVSFKFGRRATFLVAAVAASALSQASTIVQPFNFALERTSVTHTALLTKFDTSLGTLTSIDFSITGTVQTDIKVSNLSTSSPNTITATVAGTFNIKAGSSTYLVDATSIVKSGTYNKSLVGNIDYTGNRGQVFPTASNTATNSSTTSSAADKAFFSGVGSLSITILTGSTDTAISTAGNEYFESNTFAGANGYVRYTYNPVPEPASIAALGLGVVGIVRRRKGGRK